MDRLRQRGVWIDAVLAIVIAIAAASIAFDHVSVRLQADPADADTVRAVSAMIAPHREDILQPCVRRFGYMVEPSALVRMPEWTAMVSGATPSFPCAALASVAIVPVHYSFWLQQHLHRSMSWVFGITGPRLSGIAVYQAMMYGLVIALLFAVFRLGMGRATAAAAMIPLTYSPRHLEMVLAPVEYAKAPFFAACLLGVALLVRVPMARTRALAVAAVTGLVVGFGFGFKTDVLVYAPFGVLAIGLFADRAGHGWRGRAALPAVFLVALLISGAPALVTHFTGTQRSLLPVQVLGGMAPAFVDQYATPALYDYGVIFDDDYVTAQINSYNQRVNGSSEFGLFFTTALQRGASDLLSHTVRTFPGDLLLRSYAAILQVMQFVPGGAVLALVVLVGIGRTDVRLTLFIIFTLVYMVGYVSIVFAPKHYFHLEFVPWWFAGVALSGLSAIAASAAGWRPRPSGPAASWRTAAVTMFGVAVAGGGVYGVARLWQERQVAALIERYSQPDRREPVKLQVTASPAGSFVIPEGIAVSADGVAPAEDGAVAPVFATPIVHTDYLVLRARCRSGMTAHVVAIYQRPIRWQHPFDVACEAAGQSWTVMWPIYQHPPYQIFRGFESSESIEITSIDRVRDVRDYPLLVRLRLPDAPSRRVLHQRLNFAAVSPAQVRPMQAALSPPVPPLPPPAARWDPPFVRPGQVLSTAGPDPATWTPFNGVSVSGHDGEVVVEGDTTAFGYQLVSPAIAVVPHSRLAVRVFGEVDRGRAAFGILDGDGQRWLMPAVWGRSDFVANTGANDRVFMVFANYRQPSDAPVASRFTIRSVSYELQNSVFARARSILWPVAE